jgi:hypothetical protein
MLNLIATILISASLVLGGGGLTVAAAQNSQPDQLLYGVKMLTEQVQMSLTDSPEAQYQLSLSFTTQRAEEVRKTFEAGNVPAEALQTRYQDQIEQTLRLALSLGEDQVAPALNQVETQLQNQAKALSQLQMNGSGGTDADLLQTQQMLHDRIQDVELGLDDADLLRDQLHQQDQDKTQDKDQDKTQDKTQDKAQDQARDQDRLDAPPLEDGSSSIDLESSNPWTTGTPTPYSGYGPGPGPDATCTCTPETCDGTPDQIRDQQSQPADAGSGSQGSDTGSGSTGSNSGTGTGADTSTGTGTGTGSSSSSGGTGGQH